MINTLFVTFAKFMAIKFMAINFAVYNFCAERDKYKEINIRKITVMMTCWLSVVFRGAYPGM